MHSNFMIRLVDFNLFFLVELKLSVEFFRFHCYVLDKLSEFFFFKLNPDYIESIKLTCALILLTMTVCV